MKKREGNETSSYKSLSKYGTKEGEFFRILVIRYEYLRVGELIAV